MKASHTHIKLTRKINMMPRPSANSRAHVTLIQSFLFNFKSLADSRNPRRVHWKSPALLIAFPPFCLFMPPFYLLCSPFFFLCLISSRYNLEVVWGSYHSPSLCRPANQFVHLFVLLSPLSSAGVSGTVSAIDQSCVAPH